MVAYSERQRVGRLLSEAITVLCKSSLSYKFGFSVEGLIGITLDDNQVILVNINEEINDHKSWSACSSMASKISTPSPSPREDPIDLRVSSGDVKKNVASPTAKSTETQTSEKGDGPKDSPEKGESTRPRWSQGHGSRKRRLLESTFKTSVKQEIENPEDNLSTVVKVTTHVSPEALGGSHDIICIDDGDSESDTSAEDGETNPTVNVGENRLPLPPEDAAGSSTITSGPQPIIKVEKNECDESSSSNKGREPSHAVTYEAGMWAAETGNDTSGTLNSQCINQQVPYTESSVGSTVTAAVTGINVSGNNTNNNNSDISGQANTQIEAVDQTEWPADPQRRPRASYSTAYKLMVVRKAIESGNMRATARKFGIHFKQVWQWTRNKEKLLAMSLSALRSPRLWSQAYSPTRENGVQEKVSPKPSKDKDSSPD